MSELDELDFLDEVINSPVERNNGGAILHEALDKLDRIRIYRVQ